jgi:hypothetical protein
MRKREALQIENEVISRASTIETSLLTASYLISLQIAKRKTPYSIGEELIKTSLFLLCNEVLGQSAVNKVERERFSFIQRIYLNKYLPYYYISYIFSHSHFSKNQNGGKTGMGHRTRKYKSAHET